MKETKAISNMIEFLSRPIPCANMPELFANQGVTLEYDGNASQIDKISVYVNDTDVCLEFVGSWEGDIIYDLGTWANVKDLKEILTDAQYQELLEAIYDFDNNGYEYEF